VFTEFLIPTPNSEPRGITAGPDGAVWFTEFNANKIGRITTTGVITEFGVLTGSGFPARIALGPDGNLWFTEQGANKIALITPTGLITEFPIPPTSGGPSGIVAYAGNLWVTAGNILRVTPAGAITEVSIGGPFQFARDIAGDLDGNLWFSENLSTAGITGAVARMTPAGVVTEFPLPFGQAQGMTAGPDGNMWFTNLSRGIGRINLNPVSDPCTPLPAATALVAAVLPSSRSVQMGTPATAFATIINAGTTLACGANISFASGIPASFKFNATSCATNAVTGGDNVPVNIPPGGSACFVISIVPTNAFPPTEVAFNFAGSNAPPAASLVAINTLLMSASVAPVPDIVALAATLTNDGILHIPGPAGSAAFAVATSNQGIGALITVSANTGSTALPVALALCQTDPVAGGCISAVGPSVAVQINAAATPTFGIFATATGNIPLDPAKNRIFVEFSDAGVIQGRTSVAVETQ